MGNQENIISLRSVKRKAVNLNEVKEAKISVLGDKTRLAVIESTFSNINFENWLIINKELIEKNLFDCGAVLFRGFCPPSISNFERFSQTICPNLFAEYGDLPPEMSSKKVYKSTPYPSNQAILFHNESSHLNKWPMKQFFGCMVVASSGGETPIVDCRRVFNQLNPRIIDKLLEKKLLYIRNFIPGMDVSWENFYRTSDPKQVKEICKATGTKFEWDANNGLKTLRLSQAALKHPLLNVMSFFNQISLHHISCIDKTTREALLSIFGEKKLPRNVYYGDDTPIEDSIVQEICGILEQEAFKFSWKKGDILLLDNILTAHARAPFEGERKVVVAMGEMMDAPR